MKQWPKITIVTPSYNQGPFIPWTVRSVLLQRYPNLEYMVVDGGSTDDSMERLAPYADRLAWLVSEKDEGQSHAISKGFARSSGDVMAYLNSDDMLAPGTLTYVARYFAENPQIDAIYSHRCAVDADNRVKWYWILPRHSDWYMTRWDLIPQETCFWRRSLYEKCGTIDSSFHFAMDYDLFVRFMQKGKMRRLNRFLGAFRQHDDSKTSRNLNTVGTQEIKRVWQKYAIPSGRFDKLLSSRFCNQVINRGNRFARQKRLLAGCLRGTGYSYDEVWGGLLTETRLPPLNHETLDATTKAG